MPVRARRLELATVQIGRHTEEASLGATLSNSWPDLDGVRRSESGDKGANAGLKVASLVAGTVAGADSTDDMLAARRDGPGVRRDKCAVDVGIVPAGVVD